MDIGIYIYPLWRTSYNRHRGIKATADHRTLDRTVTSWSEKHLLVTEALTPNARAPISNNPQNVRKSNYSFLSATPLHSKFNENSVIKLSISNALALVAFFMGRRCLSLTKLPSSPRGQKWNANYYTYVPYFFLNTYTYFVVEYSSFQSFIFPFFFPCVFFNICIFYNFWLVSEILRHYFTFLE